MIKSKDSGYRTITGLELIITIHALLPALSKKRKISIIL